MKKETFQKRAYLLINKLECLIDKMPYQGDGSKESQKVCLQQALNEFTYTVNGVENKDFKKSEEY